MSIKPKRASRDGRRFARSSTKKGWVLRRPAHLGWILTILAGIVLVVALALVWGSHLKAEADERQAAAERGEWTLDPETAVPVPVDVPDIRAVEIYPEGNVGDILIAGDHDGVILPLGRADAPLAYRSEVAAASGLPPAAEAVSLPDDVARVAKRGLNVTCVFTVTSFEESEPALRAYRRGMELALLREYAAAGMHDILLLGLPAGNEALDREAVAFVTDLKHLLADLETPPAVGVALAASCFGDTDGEAPVAGSLTPARVLSICDYVAMDLRSCTAENTAALLPRISYVYVRYSLRLLMNVQDTPTVEDALSHGFERVFEMQPDDPGTDADETA